MYNGYYTYRVNNEIYKKGNYVNGINVGHWTYDVVAGNSYTLDWRLTPIVLPEGEINTPKKWAIFESADSSNFVTFDLHPDVKKETLTKNYFTALRHKNLKNMSLTSYNEYCKRNIYKRNVVGENCIVISIDERQFLYNIFIIKKDDQMLFVYNINGKFDGEIIDVSMVTESDDNTKNQLIFLEVPRTLKIENKPFLPRVGVLEMKIAS